MLSGVPVRHKPLGNLGSMHATAWKATCKYQCASHTQIQQQFASARHNRNTVKAFTCLGMQQKTWANDARTHVQVLGASASSWIVRSYHLDIPRTSKLFSVKSRKTRVDTSDSTVSMFNGGSGSWKFKKAKMHAS